MKLHDQISALAEEHKNDGRFVDNLDFLTKLGGFKYIAFLENSYSFLLSMVIPIDINHCLLYEKEAELCNILNALYVADLITREYYQQCLETIFQSRKTGTNDNH